MELINHELLIGFGFDEVGVSGGVGCGTSSSVFRGSGEGINSISNFLLSETKFIITLVLLDFKDVVMGGLFLSHG